MAFTKKDRERKQRVLFSCAGLPAENGALFFSKFQRVVSDHFGNFTPFQPVGRLVMKNPEGISFTT